MKKRIEEFVVEGEPSDAEGIQQADDDETNVEQNGSDSDEDESDDEPLIRSKKGKTVIAHDPSHLETEVQPSETDVQPFETEVPPSETEVQPSLLCSYKDHIASTIWNSSVSFSTSSHTV